MRDGLRVGVVGATGMVGSILLELLERRRLPVADLRAFSSGRAGASARFKGRRLGAPAPSWAALSDRDLVFLASSDEVSRRWGKALARAGVWVIDDSSAFRLDPSVPLVIPEVNGGELSPRRRLIAGPNCTITGAAVAGWPIHRRFGVRRVRLASYQAVSGAGKAAMAELAAQARGSKAPARALPRRIAYNVFPQVGPFDAAGDSSEEAKARSELRKLWSAPGLPVSATAVRVPVLRGHSLALWLETRRPCGAAQARRLIAGADGVRMSRDYATPLEAAGTAPVHVGRVRPSGASPNELALWVVSDNLLKGAALNSVQVAELLLKAGWLKRR